METKKTREGYIETERGLKVYMNQSQVTDEVRPFLSILERFGFKFDQTQVTPKDSKATHWCSTVGGGHSASVWPPSGVYPTGFVSIRGNGGFDIHRAAQGKTPELLEKSLGKLFPGMV